MTDRQNEGSAPLNEDKIEVAPELREALAAYFEQANGGEPIREPQEIVLDAGPEVQAEWRQMQALLQAPRRAVPTVDQAWQRFKAQAFDAAPALETASLGGYVAEIAAQDEQAALKNSGLSRPALEALKADPTPLGELKGYQLNDYVALARRYGVKDSAFPRLLNWLKGLARGFAAPSFGSSRSMVFARDEEARQPGLSEADLARQLEQRPEKNEDKEDSVPGEPEQE